MAVARKFLGVITRNLQWVVQNPYQFLFHPNRAFEDLVTLLLSLGVPQPIQLPHDLNIGQLKTSRPLPPSHWASQFLIFGRSKFPFPGAKMVLK